MPDYALLVQQEDDPSLFRLTAVVAAEHGPAQAVRRYTEGIDDPDHDSSETYVLVPERNFTAIARTIEVPPPRVVVDELNTGEFLTGLVGRGAGTQEPPDVPEDPGDPVPEVLEPIEALPADEAERLAASIEDDGA